MKLKKIVSLALAGILAVSMLTACGEGASEPTTPPAGDPTPASAIATALNAQLSGDQAALLSFQANSKLANAMSWMTGDHVDRLIVTDALIQGANRPTLLAAPAGVNVPNRIAQEFDGTVRAVVAQGQDVVPTSISNNRAYLYVWMVDASVSSIDTIADEVINGAGPGAVANRGLMDIFYDQVDIKDETVNDGDADGATGAGDNWTGNIGGAHEDNIGHEYRGYAEMVKVTNSNSSDTAWVVAVLIEQFSTTNT